MSRFIVLLFLTIFLLPSASHAATCMERNEACGLPELLQINAKADELDLSAHEHIAVLLEIITHLRRIITDFQASSHISDCLELTHDLRPGATDARTADEVTKLQRFLASAGVYDDIITGFYGPATARAVFLWQMQQGIPEVTETTGVGRMTRERIRQATCATLDS